MMLTHLGWHEAAELIEKGISRTIAAKRVTYDFHRLMKGAKLLKCSEFGDAIIAGMGGKPAAGGRAASGTRAKNQKKTPKPARAKAARKPAAKTKAKTRAPKRKRR
jgi:hypothetical protein